MARGKKFDKRGGGPRLDAVNEEEIEQRNARLAALEEERAQRRIAGEDDDEGDEEQAAEEIPASTTTSGKKKDEVPGTPTAHVTTEAEHRRNLAKLAEIRKRREVAEEKRKQEVKLQAAQEETERLKSAELQVQDDDDDDDKRKKKNIPKLDKITIKKMKPAQLKDALKERGLDIQGNAKSLLQRLLDYEAAR